MRSCLAKEANDRPTYAQLVRHPWLNPLLKPPAITEEDEDQEETDFSSTSATPLTADQEVAAWVVGAIERRKAGKMGKGVKPALHAAPMDALPSPAPEKADAGPIAAGGD